MSIPDQPKIYHIVYIDRLPSIIENDGLLCDAVISQQDPSGTTIGMNHIKERRLTLSLSSYPDLNVGGCVPFYFCPRSIMLYLIFCRNNQELTYTGGQDPIIHLEADLYASVRWANQNNRRWAFTLTNAGSIYFEDRCDLTKLDDIDWGAVQANRWSGTGVSSSIKEGKQAEFLVEENFPWHLIERIGVHSNTYIQQLIDALDSSKHCPQIEIKTNWYY